MFTGIVDRVGEVTSIETTAKGRRIALRGEELGRLAIGASIAVNGVCLTAVDPDGDTVKLDVIPETLSRTNLGTLESGSKVNLELPMAANGRFDGHIVQGHVDGVGTITAIRSSADGSVVMEVGVSPEMLRYLVEKGSVTIDGVSLTVASIGDGSFSVALIPHTLEVTTLGLRTEGDTVNLELDVLAKYVERLLDKR